LRRQIVDLDLEDIVGLVALGHLRVHLLPGWRLEHEQVAGLRPAWHGDRQHQQIPLPGR
jgi:hypothetical protein